MSRRLAAAPSVLVLAAALTTARADEPPPAPPGLSLPAVTTEGTRDAHLAAGSWAERPVGAATSGGAHVSAHGEIDRIWRYGPFFSRAATGGTARLQLAGGAQPLAVLEHTALLRPWDFYAFGVELEHELGVDVRPSLAARRDVWRRPHTREALRVAVTGLRVPGRRLGASMLRIEESFAWERQADGEANGRRFTTGSDWTVFSLETRAGGETRARLDLLSLEAEAVDAARDGVVMATMWARLTDLPLGPLPLSVDAAFGEASTGWMTMTVDGATTTITSEDLPALATRVGRARLGGRAGPVEGAVRASRSMYLTFDSELAIEDRAAADVALEIGRGRGHGRARLLAGGFGARTRLWRDATSPPEDTLTGGVAATVTRPLRARWELAASAEVARSFYATLAGDRAPAAGVGGNVAVELRRSLVR